MVVLLVEYLVKEGKREAFTKAILENSVAQSSREDSGNVSYQYLLSLEDSDKVLLFEEWENEESFQNHLKEQHTKDFQSIKNEYVVETKVKKFDV